MPRPFYAVIAGMLVAILAGCAHLGISNPFFNDSNTAAPTRTSRLLGVPLPPGMKHVGPQSNDIQGMEMLSGDVDASDAALSLFTALQGQGWQLRLSQRKGDRSIYAYERSGVLAVLALRRQTVATVLEIWTGPRLPDGSMLTLPSSPGDGGVPDHWGTGGSGGASSGGLQERML
ncbi:MAG: hypothetical protein LBB60_11520 [Desulfovibrio sp.]|nr:hypothetical protein [Desulfovibrio sp.]